MTLTYLSRQMVLTHTVTTLADDAAQLPQSCLHLSDAVSERFADAVTACDDTALLQVVTVMRPSLHRAWPSHIVTVHTYRER